MQHLESWWMVEQVPTYGAESVDTDHEIKAMNLLTSFLSELYYFAID
jgi:hypothetical protein